MNTNTRIIVQWLGDVALTAEFLDPSNHDILQDNVRLLAEDLEIPDLRIANWEAPLLGDEGINREKKIALHTNAQTAALAAGLKLDVALLANNHAGDCFGSGLRRTQSLLRSQGTVPVGAGNTEAAAATPATFPTNAGTVSVLAYVDRDTNPRIPPAADIHVNLLDPDRVLKDVTEQRSRGRTVLVSLHCGLDFLPLPSPQHRAFARQVIEAGASVVACYHPHRVQGFERFRDGCIIYGLGNLLAGSIYPWPRFTEPTAVVACEIEKHRVVHVRARHFILRKGLLGRDSKHRGEREFAARSQQYTVQDSRYDKLYARALGIELAFVRPLHFISRHRNPLKMLAALETRHVREYAGMIKGLFKQSRLESADDGCKRK